MEAEVLDKYVAPILLPAIMAINSYKLITKQQDDLLYPTVTFGLILSSINCILQLKANRCIRSRVRLTIIIDIILTSVALISIIGFHIIRANSTRVTKVYELPVAVRGLTPSSGGDFFRYHFFTDFIPGFIIFSQTQLCAIIQHQLVNKAKRRFKFGEAFILAQLACSCYLVSSLTIYTKLTGGGPFEVNLTNDIVLSIGLIIFYLAFVPAYTLLQNRRATLVRHGLIILSLLTSFLVVRGLTSAISNLDPLTWLIDHIFSTHQRLSLFSLWLATLTGCLSLSTSWANMVGRTNSLVRKVFHLAIGVVFVSGYNQDLEFARFAAGGTVVVMLLLELIRAWDLKPFGQYLEKVCSALRGHWDNKYLTISHIYLLLGTFLPLWITPTSQHSDKLIISCGLIAVGVGDTAAAVVGTFMGKTKLRRDSQKTLEGTLGNILAMILFKFLWVGYKCFGAELSFVFAAIFTSHVELITNTCDNLILPLVMMLLLEIL